MIKPEDIETAIYALLVEQFGNQPIDVEIVDMAFHRLRMKLRVDEIKRLGRLALENMEDQKRH